MMNLDAFDDVVPATSFPEVSADQDVRPFKKVGIGVYNRPEVYGDHVYHGITLTSTQRDQLAEFYWNYFDQGNLRSYDKNQLEAELQAAGNQGKFGVDNMGSFDVRKTIESDDRWKDLRPLYTELEAKIKELGPKVFVRTDDMSPKDSHKVNFEEIYKKANEESQKLMGNAYNPEDHGAIWRRRKAADGAAAYTSADQIMKALCTSSRVFLVAQSYNKDNSPLTIFVAKHDPSIEQSQEFRTFIDKTGHMGAISSYLNQVEKPSVKLLPNQNAYLNVIANAANIKFSQVKDYIIPGRRLAMQCGIPETEKGKGIPASKIPLIARDIISTFYVDHRRVIDFSIPVNTDTMTATARFLEANPVVADPKAIPVTDPCHFGTDRTDSDGRKAFGYNWDDAYKIEAENCAAPLNAKKCVVRVNDRSLRSAFEATKTASGQIGKVPFAKHMEEFQKVMAMKAPLAKPVVAPSLPNIAQVGTAATATTASK